MIVKIGDKKFDSDEQPIMIELTPVEKDHISSMDAMATKYCSFPEGMSDVEVAQFMEVELEEVASQTNEEKQDGEAKAEADDGGTPGEVSEVRSTDDKAG